MESELHRQQWMAAGGKVPDHWCFYTIEELLLSPKAISVGVMYPGNHSEDGVPLIRVADVTNGFVQGKPEFCVSEEVNCEYRRTQLGGEELLITLVGNPGDCVVVRPCMSGWNVARALAVLRLQRPELRAWLRYILLSKPAKHLIDARLNTTVQKTLNLKDIKELGLPIPPDNERETIVSIMAAFDEKIELNRRMNKTLESIARAMFKSWFVDFDPVRAKMSGEPPESICQRLGLTPDLLALFPNRLVDSELGEIPEGWAVKPLDMIADYLNGLALQKFPPESATEWLPVIKIAQLKKGDTVGADRASYNLKSEYIVNDGDVLFSWSGSLAVDIWCGGLGALNQHLFKVFSADYPKWFYFQWTKHHLEDFQAIAAGKAVTMGHIQRKHLTQALCVVPRKPLMDKLNDIVAPLLDKQIENRKESRTLAIVRDALLPKLLTGELRAPVVELESEAAA